MYITVRNPHQHHTAVHQGTVVLLLCQIHVFLFQKPLMQAAWDGVRFGNELEARMLLPRVFVLSICPISNLGYEIRAQCAYGILLLSFLFFFLCCLLYLAGCFNSIPDLLAHSYPLGTCSCVSPQVSSRKYCYNCGYGILDALTFRTFTRWTGLFFPPQRSAYGTIESLLCPQSAYSTGRVCGFKHDATLKTQTILMPISQLPEGIENKTTKRKQKSGIHRSGGPSHSSRYGI